MEKNTRRFQICTVHHVGQREVTNAPGVRTRIRGKRPRSALGGEQTWVTTVALLDHVSSKQTNGVDAALRKRIGHRRGASTT